MTGGKVIKIVHDGDQPPGEDLTALMDWIAEIAAEREGIRDRECELSLFFADPDEMRRLNADYRGVDKPTDVLSFAMIDKLEAGPGVSRDLVGREKDKPAGNPRLPASDDVKKGDGSSGSNLCEPQEPTSFFTLLGDIVICRAVAESQAEEYGHSIDREIAFLFTHGLLHLLGYDHGKAMRAAEEDILSKAGIER